GSVMYAYLAPGEIRRTATAQDLSVLEMDSPEPEPLTAAPWHGHQTPAPPAESPAFTTASDFLATSPIAPLSPEAVNQLKVAAVTHPAAGFIDSTRLMVCSEQAGLPPAFSLGADASLNSAVFLTGTPGRPAWLASGERDAVSLLWMPVAGWKGRSPADASQG